MVRFARGWVGMLLVITAAGPLAAQAPVDSTLSGLLGEARARRWIVRVTADSATVYHGVIAALNDSSLMLADQQLPLSEIRLLERRMSSRASLKTGAITGALIGGALGALGAAFACEMDESSDPCLGRSAVVISLTAGMGAGMGALFAGFLGRSEWRPVWRK